MAVFKGNLKIIGILSTLFGIISILAGLIDAVIYGNPYGLLITGLGTVLIIMVFLAFFVDTKGSKREKETTTETKTENSNKTTTITEVLSKIKWENYSKIEKAFKLLGISIIIFGLSYVIWVGLSASDPYMGIGVIGLGSFVVVLAGAFCLSDKWNLHAGEFRKALTISIISVYFSTLAFSNKIVVTNVTSNGSNLTNVIGFANSTGTSSLVSFVNSTGTAELHQWTMVEPVFNNLWAIVLAVIAFYFATDWIELYKKK